MPVANCDEYIDISVINNQWVETISLPMYSSKPLARRFVLINNTYTYIKHMMADIGLNLNVDYIIIPPRLATENTIQIKFRQGCEVHASMCVLLWERYKTAKIESNL